MRKIAILINGVGYGNRNIDQRDKKAGYVDAVYVPKMTIIMLEQSL